MDENAIECSFHSLEVINATFVCKGKKILTPRLSKVTKMGVKQTVSKRAQVGFRLEKFLQGESKAIPVIMMQDYYGLGYKPNAKAKSKMMKMKRERKMASLEGVIVEVEHMVFPHLRETFYLVGVEHDDIRPSETVVLKDFEKLTIIAIEGIKVKGGDTRAIVRSQSPRVAPINWTTITIPIVFSLSQ